MYANPFNPFLGSIVNSEGDDEIYAIVGRALAYAVQFEANCRALNILFKVKSKVESRELSFDNRQSFNQFVNELHKLHLSAHIRQLFEYLELPLDTIEVFRRARDGRNEIAHEICLGIDDLRKVDEELGRDELGRLVETISDATRRIAEAELSVLVLLCAVTDEDMPSKRYLDDYCHRAVKWVCGNLGALE